MDTEETIRLKPSILGRLFLTSNYPVIGIIIVMIASAAFYFGRAHDEHVWQTLFNYHAEHLLDKEQLLYQDFYHKGLAIEQRGSKAQLSIIQNAISQKETKLLSQIILSDRGFRMHLEQKASIYFSAKQKQDWLKHNTMLKSHLEKLSIYKFGLIPERFKASPSMANLVTYNFVDHSLVNFISNMVLFLLLCSLAENFIKRSIVLGACLMASVLYACTYLFTADVFTSPLQAFNGIVYFMSIVICSAFIRHQYPEKFEATKLYLVVGLVLLSVKVILDVFFNVFSDGFLIGLLPLCVFGMALGVFLNPGILKEQDQFAIQTSTQESLPHKVRQQYSEALTGLNRFNFNYARQVLQKLRMAHPDSLKILESSYHLEKLQPDKGHFWLLAESRIEQCLISQNYQDMLSVFQDIQHAAPDRHSASQHISPDHYLKILIVLVNHGNIEKAEQAFMFLELAGNRVLVKEACKLLIDTFSKKQHSQKTAHYQALLESYAQAD